MLFPFIRSGEALIGWFLFAMFFGRQRLRHCAKQLTLTPGNFIYIRVTTPPRCPITLENILHFLVPKDVQLAIECGAKLYNVDFFCYSAKYICL